jgi:hypothetical protein
VPTNDSGLTSGGFSAFVIDSTGTLWNNWQTGTGTSWSGWTSLGGSLKGTPVIVPTNSSGLTTGGFSAFGIGKTSGDLVNNWQTSPGSGWSGWTSLGGGGLTGTPVIVPTNDSGLTSGGFSAFAIDAAGALWNNWQTSPGSGWAGWASIGGGGLTGIPVIVPTNNSGLTTGGFSAFGIDSIGTLWNDWQTGAGTGWSGWTSLGGSLD